jgi:hypothetical protein
VIEPQRRAAATDAPPQLHRQHCRNGHDDHHRQRAPSVQQQTRADREDGPEDVHGDEVRNIHTGMGQPHRGRARRPSRPRRRDGRCGFADLRGRSGGFESGAG